MDFDNQKHELRAQLENHLKKSGKKKEIHRYIIDQLNQCHDLKSSINCEVKRTIQTMGDELMKDESARTAAIHKIYENVKQKVPSYIEQEVVDSLWKFTDQYGDDMLKSVCDSVSVASSSKPRQ